MSDATTTATVPLVRSNPDRCAGVLVPVSSLRTEDDLGIGDVDGLRQFVDWAAGAGLGFVQLLPINETGPDNSPYNAISSVALEPMTLDCSPKGLEDLPEATFWEVLGNHNVGQLRRGSVQYGPVRALKLDLLWRSYSHFVSEHYQKGTGRDREFHSFGEAEREWLGDYCLFRLLMDMENGSHVWQDWSEEFNTIEKARRYVDRLLGMESVKTEHQLVYYAYVQWIAFRQWNEVKDYAESKGVQLMGDIPIGVSACSVDVFANPEIFDLDWYGGAPPERLFKDDPFVQKWGQNWGIPLYRWDVLEKRDFDWWRQRVRKVSEIFSLFRIDHTLGFYRIYSFPWNPADNDAFFPLSEEEAAERCGGRKPGFRPRNDDTGKNCQANCEDGEKYLRMIQDAANGAAVIAEDLGVVPDYVRPNLAELGIPGMKVPQWEKEGGRLISGDSYPEVSFATYATHDHAPLLTQWDEQRDRMAEAEADSPEWWEAKVFFDDLCQFAGIEYGSEPAAYDDEIREKLLKALFETNSGYAAVMITDLLGLGDRINVPGVMEGSNWVFRLNPTVRELKQTPHWIELASKIRNLLIESRRAASLAANSIPEPEDNKADTPADL